MKTFTFMITSYQIILRMRNVSEAVKKIKTLFVQ